MYYRRPVVAACLIVAGMLTTLSSSAQTNILFQDDFEGNSIFAGWDAKESCCSYSLTNSTNYKRTGKKSLRVELRKSDPNIASSKRTELTDNNYPIPPETNRRWWAFSNYLPSDFALDNVHEIVAQWHDRPKTSSVSLNPPLSLQIYKGNWIIELRYDSVDVNKDGGANVKLKTFNLGPWERGVWNDWVFNYNYSYNNDGYLKIWKNGKLVLDYKGKNYYNGSYDPFFKIGLYRWVWNTNWPKNYEQSSLSTRVYYVDNVRIGNKDAILEDFLIPNPVPSNIAPIAYARYKQTIKLPTNTATISGSTSTDPDGSIVSYQWSIESGPSVPNLLTPTSADLRISGMVQGTYVYRLTVTDNQGAKGYAQSIVEMTGSGSPNQLPVVTAGSTKILTLPTSSVQLFALGSYDPDGSIAGYLWSQESGPATATISNIYASAPTMSGLVKGSYYFKLKITDNRGGYNTAYVQVLVNGSSGSGSSGGSSSAGSQGGSSSSTNKPPVANAGNDQRFSAMYTTVTLNGSGSTDPDGSIAKYQWTQVSGPNTVTLSTPTAVSTVARNAIAGTYVFQLTVTDNNGATASDQMTATLTPYSAARVAGGQQTIAMDPAAMEIPGMETSWKWPGKQLALYPNPVRNQLSVNLNSNYFGDTYIQVYSLQGILVHQEKFQKSAKVVSRSLNLGGLPTGTYLLQVKEGSHKLGQEKIIKAE